MCEKLTDTEVSMAYRLFTYLNLLAAQLKWTI